MSEYEYKPGPLDELLTCRDVAERLDVDERTVQRYCKDGTIPSTQKLFGKYVIVRRLLVEKVVEWCENPYGAPQFAQDRSDENVRKMRRVFGKRFN